MKKSFLQRTSALCAKISFAAAAVTGVFLLFIADDTLEIYKASLGASTFFFFTVGIVLHAMGAANLPSFKPDNPPNNDE